MSDSRILLLGEKETYLIRILLKKTKDAGLDCVFVKWDINEIISKWEGAALLTFYLDESMRPPLSVLRFLVDKATEEGKRFITIGEPGDMRFICDNIPGDLIYKSFNRPLDNNEYVRSVREMLEKAEGGEFRKTILIVDDDPGYMGLTREWLRDTYKVAMANSGLQAIKWLGKNKADLILLDYEMPVTTGPQVLEMLRSDDETKDIPVMFLTGKGDKESVMSVVALKPEGYFLKNIGREELLSKLQEFFIVQRHKGR